MASLDRLRNFAIPYLAFYVWLHVPMVAIVGFVVGAPWIPVTVAAAAAAGAFTAAWRVTGASAVTRQTAGLAMVAMPALLVFEFSYHPWQVDLHLYFLVCVAILAFLCDWRVIASAAAALCAYHAALAAVGPTALMNEVVALRVVLHVAFFLVEAAALMWLTDRLAKSFEENERSLAAAEESKDKIGRAHV